MIFTSQRRLILAFSSKFSDIYNDSFPLKKVINNKSIFKKPWLSKGFLKSVRQKDRLYKRYLNSPSVNNNLKYKRFKNKLNHSIRIAKRLYYEQQMDRNKSNCKKTWNILNEIINKRNQTRRLPSTFVTDNQECSDPLIANQLCKYFSNLGRTKCPYFSKFISFWELCKHHVF